MKWNENQSDQTAAPDGWGLRECLASLQTAALETTQKPLTWFLLRWRFSVEWRGNYTSWLENILKIALCFLCDEKAQWSLRGFFIIWDVACAQNGISAPDSSPPNIYPRVKFLSIKPTLIYSGERKNEMCKLLTIFHSFHVSFPSQLLLELL